MQRLRTTFIWGVIVLALIVPIVAASTSEQLAWRDPIYIGAGFAGILALGLLLLQPLLAANYLPNLSAVQSRKAHRWLGGLLVAAVVVHIAGLWITSPPDVIDALLLASPTPFSAWGVIAMWAVFAAALLAVFRRRLRLRTWRLAHTALVFITVVGTVVHAVLIEGTMETVTKIMLCTFVVLAILKVISDLRVWAARKRRV